MCDKKSHKIFFYVPSDIKYYSQCLWHLLKYWIYWAREVSEIIQFRTVIIPTQIVFMWSLKSSKLLRYCPKMYVYISCLIGNTLRLKMYFHNFAEAVIYYLLLMLQLLCQGGENTFISLHEVGLYNLELILI